MNRKLLGTLLATILLSGCTHNSGPFSGLGSKWQELRGIWGEDADGMLASEGFYGPLDGEFIPLEEDDLQVAFADAAIPQPRDIPGSPGSGIPSLGQFKRALGDLAQLFQSVYFSTDDYVIRRPEYMQVIDRAATYLKKHPNVYVSVGGHCDERGSESYNLALGTKRSNYVRTLLIQRGVDPNRIHSVSHGKEQPVDMGHNSTSWAKNRRAEFRIFEK